LEETGKLEAAGGGQNKLRVVNNLKELEQARRSNKVQEQVRKSSKKRAVIKMRRP